MAGCQNTVPRNALFKLNFGNKKQFMQSVLLNFASERVTYVRTRRNADGPDLLID